MVQEPLRLLSVCLLRKFFCVIVCGPLVFFTSCVVMKPLLIYLLSIAIDEIGGSSSFASGGNASVSGITDVDIYDVWNDSEIQRVNVPPIIWSRNPLEPSRESWSSQSVYRAFIETIDEINFRISTCFPYLIFQGDTDPLTLRNLVLMSKSVAEHDLAGLRLVSQLKRNSSFRQLIWNVRTMIEHIAYTGLSFRESEKILASIAPWVHAFMHAHFYLGFETFRLFSNVGFDFLNEIVKYHPIYTRDTDGVWYLRLESSSVVPDAEYYATQSTNRIPFMLDMPGKEDVLDRLDIDLSTTPMTPEELATTLLYRLTLVYPCDDSSHSDELRAIFYAIKYFSELLDDEPFGAAFTTEVMRSVRASPAQRLIINGFINHCASSETTALVMSVFNEFITPTNLLKLLVPLSKANSKSGASAFLLKNFDVTPTTIVQDTLRVFGASSVTKYDLADSWAPFLPSGPYPGRGPAFYRDLLAMLFDPMNEYFTRNGERYELHPLCSIQAQTAIGRIFGQIVRLDNPHGILNEYMFPAPTIFEAIFFNSMEIRNGFYDVFHDGMLDRLFLSNGTRAVEALISIAEN